MQVLCRLVKRGKVSCDSEALYISDTLPPSGNLHKRIFAPQKQAIARQIQASIADLRYATQAPIINFLLSQITPSKSSAPDSTLLSLKILPQWRPGILHSSSNTFPPTLVPPSIGTITNTILAHSVSLVFLH